MESHRNSSALWDYYWSEVDSDKKKGDEDIKRLKLLASLGYNDAYVSLRKRLGETNVIQLDEHDSELDGDQILDDQYERSYSFSEFGKFSDNPLVYECEVDEEGIAEIEFLKPTPADDRELMDGVSMDRSYGWESESTIEDADCLPYIYGGPEVENTRGWDRLGLLPDPWAEERHPTVTMITSNDLCEDDIDEDLNMTMLASGLGNFTLTPDGQGYGYTKLQLSSKGLKTIGYLRYYPYLQYVDLSNNQIKDPSPLWEIEHLVVLDLSRNLLTDESIGQPKEILFLTYLNLSHNQFTRIPDFSKSWAIKHYDLSHNAIQIIEVVTNLKYLSYLNLSYNNIEVVENLDNRLLRDIDLSHNHIRFWHNPGPKDIPGLHSIDISHNELPTLTIFTDMYNLTKLDVSFNKISAMSEFDALKTLPMVRDLKIAGNEINKIIPDSRRLIIYLVPSIKILDGLPVSLLERVSSMSFYGSNPLSDMMCFHSSSFYYRHMMKPTERWERLKETGEHPALIILIGDIGSSRRLIIDRVIRMNPTICKEITMTTTRSAIELELLRKRVKYVSMKKFNRIESEGGFVVVQRRLGHKYGIAVSELEDKDHVLMTTLGMSPALSFLWKGYKPTLIMILPNEENTLKKRCFDLFQASDVFKSKYIVMSIIGKNGSSKGSSSLMKQKVKKRGDNSEAENNTNNNKMRNGETLDTKKKAKTKKCSRMFTTAFNKKRKWKLKRYAEYCPEKKKFLDETYGVYLSSGTSGKKKWSGIPELKSTSSSATDEQEVYHAARASSEEHEFQRFVENVFRTHMSYRDMYTNNPGLFQLFISSDDLDKAANTLFEVVKSVYEKLKTSKKIKTVNMEKDPNYKSIVYEPLMEMVNDATEYDPPLNIVM